MTLVLGPGWDDGAVTSDRAGWGVVVPVKPRHLAKSRLAPLGEEARRALGTAMALDTVAAALACDAVASVLVVTDDVGLADLVRAAGARAVPDGRTGDLNASLWQGAAEVERRGPGSRLTALCGDLPCLRPDELAAVLHEAAAHGRPAFVPDVAGLGTTCYTAPGLATFGPAFGGPSRCAHLDRGAVELHAPAVTVRRDVDTPEDLAAARALGTGPATTAVLDALDAGRPVDPPAAPVVRG